MKDTVMRAIYLSLLVALAAIHGPALAAAPAPAAEPAPVVAAAQTPPAIEMTDDNAKTSLFNGTITIREALAQYPFLKEMVEDLPRNGNLNFGKVIAGKNLELLSFLYEEDPDREVFCSRLGCPFTVWANEGKGYYPVLDILKTGFTDVSARKKDNKVSLLFCDSVKGQAVWEMENSLFVRKEVLPENGPDCASDEMPIPADDSIAPAE